jgi:GNAT superfamily N-acetyltransferase
MPDYVITSARASDLRQLSEIEIAAARLLVGHARESVLAEVTPLAELEAAQAGGRLWVALHEDTPVGFAHVEIFEPTVAHLQELDVHPAHGRQGLGRRLVTEVCRWASERGHATVTLTTFRDVPWNMPFYARLGFEEVPNEGLSPALQAVREGEISRGLDGARRVTMRYQTRSTPND